MNRPCAERLAMRAQRRPTVILCFASRAPAAGDPNSNVTAVINLPVIADTLAVRAVIYDDSRGGYINNVPATFTRKPTDLGIHYANYPTGCSAI